MLNKSLHSRTIAAAFFLGLFLFIYGEKLLHTHISTGHINKEKAHVSTSSSCALCDLQPGKDAELNEPASALISFTYLPFQSIRPASILHELYFAIDGDRGPPSLG